VLELYYWEGLTTEELAEVLEIPAPTARTQLRRGRARFAEVIARLGGDDASLDVQMQELRERAGTASAA
jgi:RNA polymerase sigma-70 factor (ECF subfamily)